MSSNPSSEPPFTLPAVPTMNSFLPDAEDAKSVGLLCFCQTHGDGNTEDG
ncbi:hypothetical protein A2U01_0116903, partial [Trifolium medium]|nr:hypothetical protein [Trifolium medium]